MLDPGVGLPSVQPEGTELPGAAFWGGAARAGAAGSSAFPAEHSWEAARALDEPGTGGSCPSAGEAGMEQMAKGGMEHGEGGGRGREEGEEGGGGCKGKENMDKTKEGNGK